MLEFTYKKVLWLEFHVISLKQDTKLVTQKNSFNCLIGKSGMVNYGAKREGDGATPRGRWALKRVFYRKDRIRHIETPLEKFSISKNLGWCDEPNSRYYNKLVMLPICASHEKLWREDNKYNIVIELGFNDDPVIANKGSCIFIHCIDRNQLFTEGCIGLEQEHVIAILLEAGFSTFLTID